MKLVAALVVAATVAGSAIGHGAILLLDLIGKSGVGLLPGNENGTILGTPGSGGELGSGITFNDQSLVLSINVGWGTANGFTNLSGNASAGHIHGPTLSGGTAAFTQDASVLIGLDSRAGWNSSASAGGFNGSVTLSSTQAGFLMDGRLYINVHTATNGGGEIRGNLVVIPEPSSVALLGSALGLLARRRRSPSSVPAGK